ncbi:hypothetical protein DFJ73DRAFT_849191 [Zopfochytrium polystomum]|nr:hypothetical protein DFJ73DRAFT_849191 [Zopfochytrium polystomum]
MPPRRSTTTNTTTTSRRAAPLAAVSTTTPAAAAALLLLLELAVIVGSVVAYDFSWAPPLDKIAPTHPGWTQAFLDGKNIPDLPQTAAAAGAGGRLVEAEQLRRDGYKPNDVSIANGFMDWKFCDDSLPDSAWGLGYDDGPSVNTPGLLDSLKLRKINATFFAIGSRVLGQPDVLRRAYSEGHQIGLHTWSHPHLKTLTNDQIVSEVVYGALAIKSVLGIVPKYIRPPYGEVDDRVRAVLKAMGLRVVIWAVDSTDSNVNVTVSSISAVVQSWMTQNVRKVISVEHDLKDFQASSSVIALFTLLANGRTPLPIDQCISKGDRYDDTPLAQLLSDPATLSSPVGTTKGGVVGEGSPSSASATASATGPSKSSAGAATLFERSILAAGLVAAVAGVAAF